MIIKRAEFVKSFGQTNQFESGDLMEIAFVGRSNVGKSSLINFITNRKKLAKTSSMPGRTRLINVFDINKEFLLVDLPGYGYARASKTLQEGWKPLIEGYLNKSTKLVNVFVLLDIRHKPNQMDKQMLDFLYYYNIPMTIVATKCDKLKRSELGRYAQALAGEVGVGVKDIILTSTLDNRGHEDVLKRIENIISTQGEKNENLGD